MCETGDERQDVGPGDERQKTRDRKRNTGDERQETREGRKETGQEKGDRTRETCTLQLTLSPPLLMSNDLLT